jgi:uncharacterized protein YdcH (DUF465 family)
MSDTANLTKKEQQELRGAEARISRVAKLQQQLEEAREQASKNTVKKIEDINAQVEKLDERAAKVDEQIAAVQQRKQHLIDRRDELVKAKYVLADEIAEFLTPADHERLHLDATENVANNTPLTEEQAEAIAEQAEKDEAQDEEYAKGFADTAAEVAATTEVAEADVEAELEQERKAPAKPTRTRATKAK